MKLFAMILLSSVGMFSQLILASERPQIEVDSAQSAIDSAKLIYTVRLQIPSGNSVWTSPEFAPTGATPLQVGTLAEASCPQSPFIDVDVRHADTKIWERAQYSNGKDHYSGGSIDSIRFSINQPWFSLETCTFNVHSEVGQVNPNPNPNPNETLAGAIQYDGGFQQLIGISLTPAPFITGFRISIPQFCAQMEVLEAHTVTEGVADKALLVNKEKNIYSVNQGAGSRVSKVQLALVGPTDLKCQIPVYIFTK